MYIISRNESVQLCQCQGGDARREMALQQRFLAAVTAAICHKGYVCMCGHVRSFNAVVADSLRLGTKTPSA